MFTRTIILISALALAGCAGCKAVGGNGGGSAPVSNINTQYNEGAKMPTVQPSWK